MSQSMTLQLVVRLPDGRERELTLPDAQTVCVGREPNSDVVLPAPAVSRRHAIVEAHLDGLSITDVSANGTWIDRELVVQQKRLQPGHAVLGVGPYKLDVRRTDPVQAARPDAERTQTITGEPARRESGPAEVRSPGPEERRELRRKLLEQIDLRKLTHASTATLELRPKVRAALEGLLAASARAVAPEQRAALVQELCDEVLGLGPLEGLLLDPEVSEIMVVDPATVFVERNGKLERAQVRFTDEAAVRAVMERIVTPLGRRIDESCPLVDARLPDGSRVNAVIPPLVVKGPCITIRKFTKQRLTFERLVELDSMSERMAKFLERAVRARKNIVISGGTGSGKTTLLKLLSSAIPSSERIVTVEDAAELQLDQPHVVSLEARPANSEGKGSYTIRDLVKNALRMRPDRLLVGECRGGEALDMLQAMNTGHEGSMTTLHSNSPREALARLETLCLMSGLDLPARAIRSQAASSVHLIVQQTRFADGARRVTSISEVLPGQDADETEVRELFGFRVAATGRDGSAQGEFFAAGFVPTFAQELFAKGLIDDGSVL